MGGPLSLERPQGVISTGKHVQAHIRQVIELVQAAFQLELFVKRLVAGEEEVQARAGVEQLFERLVQLVRAGPACVPAPQRVAWKDEGGAAGEREHPGRRDFPA